MTMWDDDWDDPEPEYDAGRHQVDWAKLRMLRGARAIERGDLCCYYDLECESGSAPDPDHEDLHDISLERAVADDGG
jgi:hypothetical protein